MSARKLAGDLGVGRLAYRLLFRPLGAVRQSIAEGGPVVQRRMAAGHRAMMEAARSLPALLEPPEGPRAEVAFLSGPRFWHQTAFCFASLQVHCPFRITPIVFDDGQMDEATRAHLRAVVPWARFVDAHEIEGRLDRHLPEARFPSLRARRRGYPHLRKLTDIHAGAQGLRLVLDSDMLFHRRPDALIDWFAAPHPLYMQDVETAYGYPMPLMQALAGGPVPERVNVGLYALDSGALDWDRIEHWCRTMIEQVGPHYLQEQALTAMAFVGVSATALPRADYVVLPSLAEGQKPAAVLHHYVAHSKRSYFQWGWQRVDRLLRNAL